MYVCMYVCIRLTIIGVPYLGHHSKNVYCGALNKVVVLLFFFIFLCMF